MSSNAMNSEKAKKKTSIQVPIPSGEKAQPMKSIVNPLRSLITQANKGSEKVQASHFTPQAKSATSLGFSGLPKPQAAQEPILPEQEGKNVGRKTLILDLDETLVHSSFQPVDNVSIVLPVELEGEVFYVYVVKRPGVEKFLQHMQKIYEVVIYTASLSLYADPLLDEIDPTHLATYRLFREHCTFYNNAFVKDLSNIGRNLKDVIIVDNSPASYAFQPENAIPILTWTEDMADTKLEELAPLLEVLAKFPDVRSAIATITREDKIDYGVAYKLLQAAQRKSLSPEKRPIKENCWVEEGTNIKVGVKKATISLPKKNGVVEKKMIQKPIISSIDAHATNPLTPQYQKTNVLLASTTYASPKGGVQLGLKSNIVSKAKNIVKESKPKPVCDPKGKTKVAPAKRPVTEAISTRKKAATPTPSSNGGANKHNGKATDKGLPLHKQPRQNSASGSTRAITPKADLLSGKALSAKVAHPVQGKTSVFFTNLLKSKKDGIQLAGKTEAGPMKAPNAAPNAGGISSRVLKGIEECANKKLNKHSSSLDNTDWMACYEKLRKNLNVNSPKENPPTSGRISTNGSRPNANGVVLLNEMAPARAIKSPAPHPLYESAAPPKVNADPAKASVPKSAKDTIIPHHNATHSIKQYKDGMFSSGKVAANGKGVPCKPGIGAKK